MLPSKVLLVTKTILGHRSLIVTGVGKGSSLYAKHSSFRYVSTAPHCRITLLAFSPLVLALRRGRSFLQHLVGPTSPFGPGSPLAPVCTRVAFGALWSYQSRRSDRACRSLSPCRSSGSRVTFRSCRTWYSLRSLGANCSCCTGVTLRPLRVLLVLPVQLLLCHPWVLSNPVLPALPGA